MDRVFEVYMGTLFSKAAQEATRRRIDWICSRARGSVLDVGCSQGLVATLLAAKGIRVHAVDMDSEALDWARKNMSLQNPAIRKLVHFIEIDFSKFSENKKFDTIIAGEYIEHLSDALLHEHLEKITRLLTPNGLFICTTPLGLHPHPDHHQTFFPPDLFALLDNYFNVLHFDVEDVYFRCICSIQGEHKKLSTEQLMQLYEKGLKQVQKRHAPAKKTSSQVTQATLSQDNQGVTSLPRSADSTQLADNDIEMYLHNTFDGAAKSILPQELEKHGVTAPYNYDLKLFKALNSIYETRPLVPKPRKIDPQNLFAQAETRVNYLSSLQDFNPNMLCLELGCGRGETAVTFATRHNCHVTGVDITKYPEWAKRESENVALYATDITYNSPFVLNSFDFIYSFVVLEHVVAPLKMLESLVNLLKPGGRIYFTANLYRGPQASHRYREVFFPWPHLLFEDNIFEEYYESTHAKLNIKPAWVNKYTHLHYLEKVNELNLQIIHCNYSRNRLDKDFYFCFEDKLSKYPANDLELDFIKMYLQK